MTITHIWEVTETILKRLLVEPHRTRVERLHRQGLARGAVRTAAVWTVFFPGFGLMVRFLVWMLMLGIAGAVVTGAAILTIFAGGAHLVRRPFAKKG